MFKGRNRYTRAAALIFPSFFAPLFISTPSASAASTWINSVSGGLWSDPANWASGIIATGADSTADFSTLNLTADNTVHLDAPFTVGNLLFGDTTPSNNWTLDNNATPANTLTLATSTGSPTITVNNQTASVALDLAGTSGLTKTGIGILTFSGPNTYTGTTAILNGTLNLDFSQSSAPTSDILAKTTTLALGGGAQGLSKFSYPRLLVTGAPNVTNSQTFAATNLDYGASLIQATSGSSGTVNINLGTLSRDPGTFITFILPTSGCVTASAPLSNGILGGWATAGSAGSLNGVTYTSDFATLDSNNNVVAYSAYTDYAARIGADTGPVIPSGPIAPNVTPATNLKIVGIGTNTAPVVLAPNNDNATLDINSLYIANPVSLGVISIGAGNTLRLGPYGAIFRQDTGFADDIFVGGNGTTQTGFGNQATGTAQDVGILTAGGPGAGPGQLTLINNGSQDNEGSLEIEATVTDNPAGGTFTLIKSGPGPAKLDGHNTYTGGTYILEGRLQLAGIEIGTANPGGFGTGPVYVEAGAQAYISGVGVGGTVPNNFFIAGSGIPSQNDGALRFGRASGGTTSVTLSGLITLTGDAQIGGSSSFNSTTVTFTGKITGPYNLTFKSTAFILASSSTNDYTGNTTISSCVTLGASEQIPNGPAAGALILNNQFDLHNFNETVNALSGGGSIVNLANGTTISTLTVGDNDQSSAFGGTLTGKIALTKIGAGTFTFSGGSANITGNTTVNGGTLVWTNSTTSTSSIFINNANMIVNAGLSAGNITLNGGCFTMTTTRSTTLGNITITSGNMLITNANISGGFYLASVVTGNITINDGNFSFTGSQTRNASSNITLNGGNLYAVGNLTSNATINGGNAYVTGCLATSGTLVVNPTATLGAALIGNGSVGTVTLGAASGTNAASIIPGIQPSLNPGNISGTLTVGSLTVNTGAILYLSPGSNASGVPSKQAITSPNTVTFHGASSIIADSGAADGTYRVLTASNIVYTVSPTLISPTDIRPSQTYTLSLFSGNLSIIVAGQDGQLLWSPSAGASGNSWDTMNSPNWTGLNAVAIADNRFFAGDEVSFDDTASNPNVSVLGTVKPSAITISGNSNNFTFNGGVIAGGATLTKNGCTTLTLANANTYLGGTVLNAGQLDVNNASAIGLGPLTIAGAGVSLDNTSSSDIVYSYSINQNWNANFTFVGTRNLNLGAGNVTLGANCTLTVAANTLSVGSIRGNFSLTKSGPGTLDITGASTSTGNTILTGGTLLIDNPNALADTFLVYDNPGTNVTFGNLTSATIGALSGSQNLSLTNRLGQGVSLFVGRVPVPNSTYSGSLSGNGAFYINGYGNLTLTGNNTYTGSTNLEQGNLILGSPTALPANTALSVGASIFFSHLDLNGNNIAVSSLSDSGCNTGVIGSSSTTSNSSITINNGSGDYRGVIQDTLGGGNKTLSITLNNAALQLDSTQNTYSGGTTLNGGLLIIYTDGSLGAITSPLYFNSGTLAVNGDLSGSTRPIFWNPNGGTFQINAGYVIGSVLSGGALTSTGSGPLILNNNYIVTNNGITSVSNTLQLNGPSNSTAAISGASGKVTVGVGAALSSGTLTLGILTINGSVQIRSGSSSSGPSKLSSLILAGSTNHWTGTLDLTNNEIIIEDASANRAADLANLKNQVADSNIQSSTAAPGTVVAVVDNALRMAVSPTGATNFGGNGNVDASSILITTTYKGDTNLDGVVDLKDLMVLATHWQQRVSDWSQADFDGNGVVDLADLQALAGEWQAGVPSGSGSGESFSQALSALPALNAVTSSVPEPASLMILSTAAAALLRRRIKRR